MTGTPRNEAPFSKTHPQPPRRGGFPCKLAFFRFPTGFPAQAFYRILPNVTVNGTSNARPASWTIPYDLTPDGLAFAIFCTKVHDRVLAPLSASGQPQAPPQLRAALRTISQQIDQRISTARLPAAA